MYFRQRRNSNYDLLKFVSTAQVDDKLALVEVIFGSYVDQEIWLIMASLGHNEAASLDHDMFYKRVLRCNNYVLLSYVLAGIVLKV